MDQFETGDLPHVTSDVDHFVVNPDGGTDGLVLANGLEVNFPPAFQPKCWPWSEPAIASPFTAGCPGPLPA